MEKLQPTNGYDCEEQSLPQQQQPRAKWWLPLAILLAALGVAALIVYLVVFVDKEIENNNKESNEVTPGQDDGEAGLSFSLGPDRCSTSTLVFATKQGAFVQDAYSAYPDNISDCWVLDSGQGGRSMFSFLAHDLAESVDSVNVFQLSDDGAQATSIGSVTGYASPASATFESSTRYLLLELQSGEDGVTIYSGFRGIARNLGSRTPTVSPSASPTGTPAPTSPLGSSTCDNLYGLTDLLGRIETVGTYPITEGHDIDDCWSVACPANEAFQAISFIIDDADFVNAYGNIWLWYRNGASGPYQLLEKQIPVSPGSTLNITVADLFSSGNEEATPWTRILPSPNALIRLDVVGPRTQDTGFNARWECVSA